MLSTSSCPHPSVLHLVLCTHLDELPGPYKHLSLQTLMLHTQGFGNYTFLFAIMLGLKLLNILRFERERVHARESMHKWEEGEGGAISSRLHAEQQPISGH